MSKPQKVYFTKNITKEALIKIYDCLIKEKAVPKAQRSA